MFSDLRKKEHGSNAAVLHRKYNAMTQRSNISDWRQILTRISYSRASHLVDYLVRNAEFAPSSKKVSANLNLYLKELDEDPVASRLPYSQADEELSLVLHIRGHAIAPEYVADARRRYVAELRSLEKSQIYPHLPPFSVFVVTWFSTISDFGTMKMRRFCAASPKWKGYLQKIAKTAGISFKFNHG